MNEPGDLYVVSAPSGAGKRTVLEGVMADDDNLVLAISATTRPPRQDEADGIDYYFLDRDEFVRRVEEDAFAEWAEVHGNLYGTLREELERQRATGKDVVLELDVQGMSSMRRSYPEAVTIFIMPPSLETLEARLRGRETDDEDVIELRLSNARAEMDACGSFDHSVINDDLAKAVADVKAIIRAQRRLHGRPENPAMPGHG